MKAHIQTQFPPKILFYAIKPGSEKERALGRSLPGGRDSLGGGSGWPAGRPVGVAGRTGRLFPFFGAVGKRTARSGSHGVLWAGRKKVRQLLGKMGEAQLQVELKAMMTPHNQRWPFGALLGELEKEHLALHRR